MGNLPSRAYREQYKDILHSLVLPKIDRPGMKILDIGCGYADDLLYVCWDRDVTGYGIEMDSGKLRGALEKTRQSGNIFLAEANAEILPYRDNAFDIIIISEVIEHLYNADKCLSEIYRVLKSDGTLVVSTPSRYNYVSLMGRLVPRSMKTRLRRLVYYGYPEHCGTIALPDGRVVKEHVHEFIPSELKRLLRRKGFRVRKIAGGFLLVPVSPLYDRFPFFRLFWKTFDSLISRFPFSVYMKANFLMEVKKDEQLLNPDRILIINLGGIGDFLLSTPALKALRKLYPRAHISVLVTPRIVQLAEGLPYIDEVIPFSFIKILSILRRRNYDLLINMRSITSMWGALKMFAMVSFIRARCTIGRDTDGRGFFFDIKIMESDLGTKYEMEYDLDTARVLGSDVSDKSVELPIGEEDFVKVEALLKSEGIQKDDVVVGIHPGGAPAHRWPLENFAKAIDAISDRLSCKFLITGGPGEEKLFGKLKNLTKAPLINFVGRLTIKELAVLIKRCNLFIADDSGPMHIAAVLKTPLIALFGPGYITRFDPQHISDKAVIVQEKTDCAPCNRTRCADLRCLKAIPPARVAEAAVHYLESND